MLKKKSDPDPTELLPLSPPALHLLLALAGGDRHGWAIMKEIAAATEGQLHLSAGTLYGLIKRLLGQGLITESNDRPPQHWDDERRRYYRLTALGRAVARAEVARLEQTLSIARAADLLPREA